MDPNVWIADTAATVHNTPHMDGMTNLRVAEKSDAITMGDGMSEKAVCVTGSMKLKLPKQPCKM
jgi:hypothetical protein